MGASRFVIVLAWFHVNFGFHGQVEISKFCVLVEHLATMIEDEVGVEAGIDVGGKVLSELKDHFVLYGLDGNLTVVKVNDSDIAELVC